MNPVLDLLGLGELKWLHAYLRDEDGLPPAPSQRVDAETGLTFEQRQAVLGWLVAGYNARAEVPS